MNQNKQTAIVHIVRVYAGDGSLIGGRLENDFGSPLTRREALMLARAENERSERRKAQKLPGAFYYYADNFTRKTSAYGLTYLIVLLAALTLGVALCYYMAKLMVL